MGWTLFGKRRIRLRPEALAQSLYDEFVEEPVAVESLGSEPEVTSITSDPRYATRVRLFRIAAILLGVEVARRKRPRFGEVRGALERLIYPATTEEGSQLFSDVIEAMKELSELVETDNAGTAIKWSTRWFAAAGFQVTNPVVLHLHSLAWMRYWVMVNKSLSEFEPL